MAENLPWTREDLRACHLADFQAHAVRKAAERNGYALRIHNNGHHWQFKHPEGRGSRGRRQKRREVIPLSPSPCNVIDDLGPQ